MSQRYPHPFYMVSLLKRNKKNTNLVSPHPLEYLYSVRPCIQSALPETNHRYKNYSPLEMSKKGILFTSTNVAPADQLNTQFKI